MSAPQSFTPEDVRGTLGDFLPRVYAELERADQIHGSPIRYPGTGPSLSMLHAVTGDTTPAADLARREKLFTERCDRVAAELGAVPAPWIDVLFAEVFELAAELPASDNFEAEAAQVVSTVVRMVTARRVAARRDLEDADR